MFSIHSSKEVTDLTTELVRAWKLLGLTVNRGHVGCVNCTQVNTVIYINRQLSVVYRDIKASGACRCICGPMIRYAAVGMGYSTYGFLNI